jgi:hypothetical protein
MIVLSSLSFGQAKGLRHSSRGHRPRNAISLKSLCPVRALQPFTSRQKILSSILSKSLCLCVSVAKQEQSHRGFPRPFKAIQGFLEKRIFHFLSPDPKVFAVSKALQTVPRCSKPFQGFFQKKRLFISCRAEAWAKVYHVSRGGLGRRLVDLPVPRPAYYSPPPPTPNKN